MSECYDESIESMYRDVLDRSSAIYYLHLRKGEDDFRDQLINPMLADTTLDPRSVQAAFVSSPVTKTAPIESMRVSCAYATTALRAYKAGNELMAWVCMSHAQYWLGISTGVAVMPDAVDQFVSGRAQAGATKRDAKFAPLRTLARELAANKNYPSKRNAALSIKPEILAAAKAQNINLSEMQAERTITGWLDGMPFGSKQ